MYPHMTSLPKKHVRETPLRGSTPPLLAFCRAELRTLIPRADRWAQPYLIQDTGERDTKGGGPNPGSGTAGGDHDQQNRPDSIG
jgi:hypothetical protein